MPTHNLRNPRKNAVLAGVAALTGAAIYNLYQNARAEERHPPQGRLIDVDGTRLHVLDVGRGRPIVLIHGNGSLIHDFEASGLIAELSLSNRVIAFDRPGFGYSDRPRSRIWTARAQAKAIGRALHLLNVDDICVVGHSFGALVAMALALEMPDRVTSVVAASGFYYPQMRIDVAALAVPAVPVVGDVLNYTLGPIAGSLVTPAFVSQLFAPLPVDPRFTEGFPISMALRTSQIHAFADDNATLVQSAAALAPEYRSLACRVAIVSGDRDQIVDWTKHSRRLHDDIPASELHVVKGVGHMTHYACDELILRLARQRS